MATPAGQNSPERGLSNGGQDVGHNPYSRGEFARGEFAINNNNNNNNITNNNNNNNNTYNTNTSNTQVWMRTLVQEDASPLNQVLPTGVLSPLSFRKIVTEIPTPNVHVHESAACVYVTNTHAPHSTPHPHPQPRPHSPPRTLLTPITPLSNTNLSSLQYSPYSTTNTFNITSPHNNYITPPTPTAHPTNHTSTHTSTGLLYTDNDTALASPGIQLKGHPSIASTHPAHTPTVVAQTPPITHNS
jgi:hypothetical protein